MAMGAQLRSPWGQSLAHLQCDSVDDVQGVNDVAQRFAHLPAMSISHDGMEVDLQGR